jgi:hypothetical protein
MSKEMYALIDATLFTPGKKPTTNVPDFPRRFEADGTTVVPYRHEETINITWKFDREQNYHKTCINIYQAVYDTLDSHVGDGFKVAPATMPPMIGWNSTMTLNDIFNQLMMTYEKPTPNAMHQNNLNFLAAYNPQEPPEPFIQKMHQLSRNCHHCQSALH